ncbi:MAG: hypothetical protein R3C51_01375 [Parvularculaceae bacterium]
MASDRVEVLAIIAIVLGIVAMSWGAWTLRNVLTSSAGPSHQQADNADTQERAANSDGDFASLPPSQNLQSPAEDKKESKAAAANDDERINQTWVHTTAPKFSTNFWIAVFTGGLFAAAIIQALTVSWQANIAADTLNQMRTDSAGQVKQFIAQLDVAKRSADAATKNVESFVRLNEPFLFLEPVVKFTLSDPREIIVDGPAGIGLPKTLHDVSIDYNIKITNYGKSPCIIREISQNLFQKGTKLDPDFVLRSLNLPQVNVNEVPNPKPRVSSYTILRELQWVMPDGVRKVGAKDYDRDDYKNAITRSTPRKNPIVFEATVVYEDFFGVGRKITQVWHMNAADRFERVGTKVEQIDLQDYSDQ